MSDVRPSRKKYVLLKLMVWKTNKDYVVRVADGMNVPVNEAARRILSEAEARGIFLPNDFRSETLTGG